MLQVDRLLVGGLERSEFLLRESHVLVRLIGISLDDLLGRDGAVLGTAFAVLDPLAADGMELPQGNLRRRGDGRIGLHRHAERAEFQLTAPTGAAGRRSVRLARARRFRQDSGCHTRGPFQDE